MQEIDPDHPSVLYSLSFQALAEDNDLVTAARYLERSCEADPTNFNGLLTLTGFGRSDLAAEVGEYVLARDPLCQDCRESTARAYRNLGDFDRSIELLRKGLELDPEWVPGHSGLTLSLVYAGRPEEALENAVAFEEMAKQQGIGEAPWPGHLEALHDLGMTGEFEALLPGYIEGHVQIVPDYIAQVYAWIGDADRAIEWLDKVDTTDSYRIRHVIVRTAYQQIYDDPRMQALLERYQLMPEQVEAVGLDLDPCLSAL